MKKLESGVSSFSLVLSLSSLLCALWGAPAHGAGVDYGALKADLDRCVSDAHSERDSARRDLEGKAQGIKAIPGKVQFAVGGIEVPANIYECASRAFGKAAFSQGGALGVISELCESSVLEPILYTKLMTMKVSCLQAATAKLVADADAADGAYQAACDTLSFSARHSCSKKVEEIRSGAQAKARAGAALEPGAILAKCPKLPEPGPQVRGKEFAPAAACLRDEIAVASFVHGGDMLLLKRACDTDNETQALCYERGLSILRDNAAGATPARRGFARLNLMRAICSVGKPGGRAQCLQQVPAIASGMQIGDKLIDAIYNAQELCEQKHEEFKKPFQCMELELANIAADSATEVFESASLGANHDRVPASTKRLGQ